MKLAQYKSESGYIHFFEADEFMSESTSYTRMSEIVEVEFKPLPPEVTVPAELARIDAAEAELRNKFNEKLSELNTRRANLQAITHQVSA